MRNFKFSRGYFLFSREERENSSDLSFYSSEVSFDSSEVSFDSSEVSFLAYVAVFHLPRGDLRISTWGSAFSAAKAYRGSEILFIMH